jgi:hypothetical protein
VAERLTIELWRSGAGQIEGRAWPKEGRPVLTFAGVLELLKVLEDLGNLGPPTPSTP